MRVDDILTINALNWPDRTALIAGEARISFSTLAARVRGLANALAAVGEFGDRIAILATNTPAYVEALYGVPASGRILTLVNYRLHPSEWAYVLNNARARAIIVEDRFLASLEGVLGQVPSIERVFVTGDGGSGSATPYEAFLAKAPQETMPPAPADTDVACIIYTSGTTGFPKGAMITHRAILAAASAMVIENRQKSFGMALQTFPLCHASAFQLFAHHMRVATVVLPSQFEAGLWLELIERHRIDYTGIAPTMAHFVINHPAFEKADLSTVKSLSYGGMAFEPKTARVFYERVGHLWSGFGQSETTLMATHLSEEDHDRIFAGEEHLLRSCGRPNVYSIVKILDDEMKECPVGEPGEMCVRSPTVMKGYWDNEEGTREAFAGGWLHTGDIASRDAEGYITIVDRKKDMLKTGGQNVYPREIEQVIVTHPAVGDVAVVGLPDPVWGENVAAAVMLRPGMTLSVDDIIAFCAQRLAGYKKPKQVFFVDDLPRNITGKVQKRALKESLLAGIAQGDSNER